MQFVKTTPVKRYHQASKQLELFSKQDLQQQNLTLGRLLGTRCPMPVHSCGEKKTGQPSASLPDIVSLILHTIWTNIKADRKDYTSLHPDDYSFGPLENLSNSMPAAPLVTTNGPVPISSDGPAVVEQPGNSESLPENDSRTDSEPNPDPGLEPPSFNQATY